MKLKMFRKDYLFYKEQANIRYGIIIQKQQSDFNTLIKKIIG